MSIAEHDSKL